MYTSIQRIMTLIAVGCIMVTAGCKKSEDEEVAQKFGIDANAVRDLHARGSLNNQALLAMSKPELSNTIRELRPDLPRQRAAFRNLQQRVNGVVPPKGLENALLALQQLRLTGLQATVGGMRVGRIARAYDLVRPTPATGVWQPLGPGNIGGRTRSILVDPDDPEQIWIGSVGGGVWHSDDRGITFKPADDFMPNLAICCMVMDITDKQHVIYVGTGEGFYNDDAIRGAGVFRSPRQAGGKWELLLGSDKADMRFMTRIALSADGRTMLIAGQNGEPVNVNGQRNPKHSAGIFVSTKATSGWASDWPKAVDVAGKPLTEDVADVKFHPKDSSQAIAGGLNGLVWYSTDGGNKWLEATHDQDWSRAGRVELTYAAHDPSIVYALVDSNGGEIYKSIDGGKKYTLVKTGLSIADATILGGQGWYDNVIWAGDPDNASLVIAGGINLWRSLDGAQSFVDISDWQQSCSIHADQHAIVASAEYGDAKSPHSRTIFVSNDGGIFQAGDILTVGSDPGRGTGWSSLNRTYATTQFFGGAYNSISGEIMGGAQDNGTLEIDKGDDVTRWRVTSSGDGGECFAHPQLSNTFYGEYVNLDLIRSSDDGRSAVDLSGIVKWQSDGTAVWKADGLYIPDAKVAFNDRPDNDHATTNFVSPFAVDMSFPSRIYAGGAHLWRTSDADAPVDDNTGPHWQSVKDVMSGKSPDRLISAVAVNPHDANEVWVGYNSGRIFRTGNATEASPRWDEVKVEQKQKSPLGRMCTRVVFSPTDSKTIYLTFGGYEADNVWVSHDHGASWSSIHSNLPKMPVYVVTAHPRNPQVLYVGSELGVFTSRDGGGTWSPANTGPANCSVQDLFWKDETLVAATHGRGMFTLDLSQ
jgi:hypothetical protein